MESPREWPRGLGRAACGPGSASCALGQASVGQDGGALTVPLHLALLHLAQESDPHTFSKNIFSSYSRLGKTQFL